MNERNPLVDDLLQEARARQRRLLAGIEDDLLERYRPPRSESLIRPNLTTVERELRRLADSALEDPAVKAALDRSAEFTRLTLTADFFRTRAVEAEKSGSDNAWLITEWAYDVARTFAKENKSELATTHEGNVALAKLVPLLIWADELAEDDYIDARLLSAQE